MKHIDDAIAHAKQSYPHESCGFFVLKKGKLQYVACTNLAQDTEDEFLISVEDYARAEKIGEMRTVVHSHPNESCLPSIADQDAHKVSGLEWCIIGLEGDEVSMHFMPAVTVIPDLYGRKFIHGMTDCYGFVRDWYQQELGIELPNYNRTDGWWNEGGNLYVDNFEHAGFYQVDDLQVGDMIVMQINANVPNHAGVYLGDGLIGHHLYGRLSSKDVYGQFYRDRTTHIMRHKKNTAQG
ncbi:TPA: C40 family peptidase [Pasteurella multocida]|nr:C40 family peptidase [Pasteurella multocida]